MKNKFSPERCEMSWFMKHEKMIDAALFQQISNSWILSSNFFYLCIVYKSGEKFCFVKKTAIE